MNSQQVMQIIKSVRTARRTPQEILAAFNNEQSNETAYGPSQDPPPPITKPSALIIAIQPPTARKSKSPIKALPTPAATSPEGGLIMEEPEIAAQEPEIAAQQPVKPRRLLCPICGENFHLRNQCPLLASDSPEPAQRVQGLRNEGKADPVQLTKDHQSNRRNARRLEAVTGKQRISDPSVSPEVQSRRLLPPPPIVDSYRSEITVQSPGEGSSSPPSSDDEQPGDGFDEIDAAEPLLELSAKNVAMGLVSRSPTPIPSHSSAERDEISDGGVMFENESSETEKRQVPLPGSSYAHRKSSESYRSNSSSDSPSAKDIPRPASQTFTLTAPPIVQSASLIRARPESTLPSSPPIPVAVDLSPEVPESPVIEKPKSPKPGETRQPQDEELESIHILHHVCYFFGTRKPTELTF